MGVKREGKKRKKGKEGGSGGGGKENKDRPCRMVNDYIVLFERRRNVEIEVMEVMYRCQVRVTLHPQINQRRVPDYQ